MSHGYVDDIPGHREFWLRFRDKHDYSWRRKDYKLTWADRWKNFKWKVYGRQRLRIGLLQRLRQWKRCIRILRKEHPDYELWQLEHLLIAIEVGQILRDVGGVERNNDGS